MGPTGPQIGRLQHLTGVEQIGFGHESHGKQVVAGQQAGSGQKAGAGQQFGAGQQTF